MNKETLQFRIINVSKRNITSYGDIFLVEASIMNTNSTKSSFDNDSITDEFRLSMDSSLIEEVKQAYKYGQLWQVDMSRFQKNDNAHDINGNIGNRIIYDELVVINEDTLKNMLDKAIRKSVLAQMGFAGLDELQTYTAKVTTMKDGYVYTSHDLDSLVAEDEDDAYNVMLSVLSHREGRIVRSSDILSYTIKSNGEKLFDFN